MTWQLILVALFFAGIGVYALAKPGSTLKIMQIDVTTTDGKNEIRAVYGGMCLAIAGVLFYAPALGAARQGIYLAVVLLLAGMIFGRIFSFALDQGMGKGPRLFLLLEAISIALLMNHADFTSWS